jgi:hypothetical protein
MARGLAMVSTPKTANGKNSAARRLVGEGGGAEARDLRAGKAGSSKRRLSLEGTLPAKLEEQAVNEAGGKGGTGEEVVLVEKEEVESKAQKEEQAGAVSAVKSVTRRASMEMRAMAAAGRKMEELQQAEAASLAAKEPEKLVVSLVGSDGVVGELKMAVAEGEAVEAVVTQVEMSQEEAEAAVAAREVQDKAKRQSTMDMASQYKTKNFSRKFSAPRARKDSVGRKSSRDSKRGSQDSLVLAVAEIERVEMAEATRAAAEMEKTWMTKGVAIEKRLSAQESFEACMGSAREYHRAIVTLFTQKHEGWEGGQADDKVLKAIGPIAHILDSDSDEETDSDNDSGADGSDGEDGEAAESEKLSRGEREGGGRDQYGEVRCFGLPLPALVISDGGALTARQRAEVLSRSQVCFALALAPPAMGALHIRAGRIWLQQLERVLWVLLDDLVSKVRKFATQWLADPMVFHGLQNLVTTVLFTPGPDQLSLVNWRCAGGFEIDAYELGLRVDEEEDEDEENEDGMDVDYILYTVLVCMHCTNGLCQVWTTRT